MEYNIDNAELTATLTAVNLDAAVIGQAPLEVAIGESARIDVGQAINYVKAGAAEIAAAVQEGTTAFDLNAEQKTADFNFNASDKTAEYNQNADNRLSEYNANASNKLNAYNENATAKVAAYDNNAATKTQAYNDNATAKTTAFDGNYRDKLSAFNNNASAKTQAFDDNATAKTTAFNDNAAIKQAAVDASANAAAASATTAKQYAIGVPSEPSGYSAKYWAEQTAQSLSGLQSDVAGIKAVIPASATASNKLTDKSYVDTADNDLQSQIDAITASSDVTDIVGTYAELQSYDTSTLPPNSIIKVLQDESRNNETTYYRWVITGGVGAWSLIGEEGPYYTKAESDNLFPTKSITGASLDYTGTTLSLLNPSGTSLSSVTIKSTPDLDGVTIDTNSDDELEAIGVIDNNGNAIKTWIGTLAQYNAIAIKDLNTLYNITDDVSVTQTILEALYPVGSLYIGKMSTCPLASLIPNSTWRLVASDKVLQGSGTYTAGTSVNAGLPNITGEFGNYDVYADTTIASGAFQKDASAGNGDYTGSNSLTRQHMQVTFSASRSSSIYGNSNTVQPPAYVVNIWERTA